MKEKTNQSDSAIQRSLSRAYRFTMTAWLAFLSMIIFDCYFVYLFKQRDQEGMRSLSDWSLLGWQLFIAAVLFWSVVKYRRLRRRSENATPVALTLTDYLKKTQRQIVFSWLGPSLISKFTVFFAMNGASLTESISYLALSLGVLLLHPPRRSFFSSAPQATSAAQAAFDAAQEEKRLELSQNPLEHERLYSRALAFNTLSKSFGKLTLILMFSDLLIDFISLTLSPHIDLGVHLISDLPLVLKEVVRLLLAATFIYQIGRWSARAQSERKFLYLGALSLTVTVRFLASILASLASNPILQFAILPLEAVGWIVMLIGYFSLKESVRSMGLKTTSFGVDRIQLEALKSRAPTA